MQTQSHTQNTLKSNKHDYTNVSTENNSQHSLDSNKSNYCQNNYQINNHNINEETIEQCQNTQIDEEGLEQDYENKAEFYKKTINWLAKKYKKFKIKIQTLYLTISYLIKYINQIQTITYKAELIGAVCLLLASKMNQIYVPSIKSILNSFDFKSTKKQIIQVEHEILELFGYQIGLDRNSYSILYEILQNQEEEKRRNAEKLLFLSLFNLNTLEYGEDYLGWSIIYLVRPELFKQTEFIDKDKVKKIALCVYKIYKEKKQSLRQQSSN